MNHRRVQVALVIVVLSLAGVAAVTVPRAGAAGAQGRGPEPVYALLGAAELEHFEAFDLWWAGASFEGLPLSAVVRQFQPPRNGEPRGRDSVDFLYGDCDASSGSCALPLEIQVWPACERNRSSYELAPGVSYPYEPLEVRGTAAAMFDDGGRLEIYTGAVTVVIFGDSPERLRKAADALHPPGRPTAAPGERLAPPVAGALEGTLDCRSA